MVRNLIRTDNQVAQADTMEHNLVMEFLERSHVAAEVVAIGQVDNRVASKVI